MTLFPPVGWADVATKTDLHAQFDRLECKIDRVTSELRAEIRQSIRNQTRVLIVWTSGWTTALAGLIIALDR